MSVQEIEAAITELPAKDLGALVAWLADYHQQVWDQQIECNLEAGRLDALLDDVRQECRAGGSRSL